MSKVTWLWLKYFLLYHVKNNPDGCQLLSCSLLCRKKLTIQEVYKICIVTHSNLFLNYIEWQSMRDGVTVTGKILSVNM